MKRFLLTSAFIIAALVASVGAAAATTFELAQMRNAIVGRPCQVAFVLRSDDSNALRTASDLTPDPPKIDGFKLYSGPGITNGFESGYDSRQGSYQYYTLSIVYVFIPEREGSATIPSVSIRVNGQTLKTKPQTIKVLPPSQQQAPAYGGGYPQGSTSGGGEQVVGSSVGQTKPEDLMVIITFSRKNVYEMEPVVADIKLCLAESRRFDIENQFNSVTLPVFDGFLSEDLPVPQRSQIENIGGRNYETLVMRRYLLYPQKAGHLSVSSGEYEINVIEYQQVTRGRYVTNRQIPRKMKTATNRVSLDVKALPEPRPADFSGAVGRFSISAEINPEIVRTNESATYTLKVTGAGNIKYLTAPKVTFPSTFETYTAKTDIDAKFDGSNYSGTFTADYPFVPQEVGKFAIEPFKFVYFNPATATYETATAQGFDLNVIKGNGPAVIGAQKGVNTEMTDILHIRPLPAKVKAATQPVADSWWYWCIYAVAALGLLTVVAVYRRHVKRSADVAGRRLARANRVVSKRFRTAEKFMRQHKSEQFYEELARALKGYLGDKLGLQASGLLSDVITERLEARGVSPEVTAQVIEVLNDCEMARFTPSASDDAMSDVFNRATAAVKAIENIK